MKEKIPKTIFGKARKSFSGGDLVNKSRNSALKSAEDALRRGEIDSDTAKRIRSGLWKMAYIWLFGKK